MKLSHNRGTEVPGIPFYIMTVRKPTNNNFLACHMSGLGQRLTWHAASLVGQKVEKRIIHFGAIKSILF